MRSYISKDIRPCQLLTRILYREDNFPAKRVMYRTLLRLLSFSFGLDTSGAGSDMSSKAATDSWTNFRSLDYEESRITIAINADLVWPLLAGVEYSENERAANSCQFASIILHELAHAAFRAIHWSTLCADQLTDTDGSLLDQYVVDCLEQLRLELGVHLNENRDGWLMEDGPFNQPLFFQGQRDTFPGHRGEWLSRRHAVDTGSLLSWHGVLT